VIAMVSVGAGADRFVQQQIASFGTNIIMVIPGAVTSGGARSGWGGASTLTVGDAGAIERVPELAAVTYSRRQIAQIVYGSANWSTVVQGVTDEFKRVRDWQVASGGFFTERHERSGAKVAVLGQTVVRNLFSAGQDPVGTVVRIKNVPFKVIGVLAPKGQSSWGQDQDDVVMIPFSTAERRVMGAEILGSVEMIYASARRTTDLPAAAEGITTVLRQQHRIGRGRGGRLHRARHDGDVRGVAHGEPSDDEPARGDRVDLAPRRRHRHHEHPARVGRRADARDRHPSRRRREGPAHPAAVPGRVDRAERRRAA
jgi:putative ABC transport system permease protein